LLRPSEHRERDRERDSERDRERDRERTERQLEYSVLENSAPNGIKTFGKVGWVARACILE
jgi:hypothetical protein